MSIKVDVRTNINDYELTLEKCSEIITLLQDTYQNIRNDMYARFLSIRILIKTLSIVACLIVLYFLQPLLPILHKQEIEKEAPGCLIATLPRP